MPESWCDGASGLVQPDNQPILKFRHLDFLSSQAIQEAVAGFALLVNSELLAEAMVLYDNVIGVVAKPFG